MKTNMAYTKKKTTSKKTTSSKSTWKKSYSWVGYSKWWKDDLNFYGISIGRVQNPILRTCIEKYLDPLINGKWLELKKKLSLVDEQKNKWDFALNKQYETAYDKMQKAYEVLTRAFENWEKEMVVNKISTSTTTLKRWEPFSLSTLQSECLTLLWLKPKEAMAIAQKLFEMGLTSYPRTDSITVPEEYEEKIKKTLGSEYKHQDYKDKWEFVQASHYAIIFTDTKYFSYKWDWELHCHPPVDWEYAQVYELIVRRTLSAFFKEEAKGETTTYTATYKTLPFEIKSKRITQKGFLTIYNYPSDWEDDSLSFQEWDKVKVKEFILKDVDIKISVNIGLNKIKNDLESKGIARPSTWASILQIVEDRQLVKTSGANLLALPKWVWFWYLLNKENQEHWLFDTFNLELTAWMEKELDKVAKWEEQAIDVLNTILEKNFLKYL